MLRAALALCAPAYLRLHGERIAPAQRRGARSLEPFLEEAAQLLPALRGVPIRCAWALGPRGRALPSGIYVGVPGDWGGLEPSRAAILALHERSVQLAAELLRGRGALPSDPEERYVRIEWEALGSLSARLQSHRGRLQLAHREWLEAVHLDPLIDGALVRGLVGEADAKRLLDDPAARASTLALLGST